MIPRMCLWEGFAVPCVTAQLQLCQEWQRMTNPAGLEQKRGMLLEVCELQSWQWQPRAPQPSVSAWSTDIFTQGDANGIHPAQAPKLIFITVFLERLFQVCCGNRWFYISSESCFPSALPCSSNSSFLISSLLTTLFRENL